LTAQNVEDLSFANVHDAMKGVDLRELTLKPLVGDGRITASLVVWPPDSEPQECRHDDFIESALVLSGEIIDEDGTTHTRGAVWLRPPGQVHRPRAGHNGAQLVLWRVAQEGGKGRG
jgi:quercetin dioxygenase-like cupin family protein